MKDKEILKKYVCLNPFKYLDIQSTSQWVCCPSWCPTDIRKTDREYRPVTLDENLADHWFSETAKNIRQSVTDGSYRHCDHQVCPSLSQLISTGVPLTNFVTKEEFEQNHDVENFSGLPEEILFGFDSSCNLACPSCRSSTVYNDELDSHEYKIKKHIINNIENKFGKSVKKLYITGSGDPIYSKIYRNYLQNFDKNKFPNIEEIVLITNANLLNEKMWNSLQAREYITNLHISIDAGTRVTYESLVRIKGDWHRLLENLEFISTVDTIKEIVCSMVVSIHNYKEMQKFHELIWKIFSKSKALMTVLYTQHVYWASGSYSLDDMNYLSVFDSKHPKHDSFLEELNKVHNLPWVRHNFHHLLHEQH